MQDRRTALPPGTRLKLLSTGSIYEISAAPIGFGGAGIIYPARRMVLCGGELRPDGILYALKECYPGSDVQEFCRSAAGEITAAHPDSQAGLEEARARYFTEKKRNQAIHVTANRMLPILEASEEVALTLPGREVTVVTNAVSVMESLEKKGRSLSVCLEERRRFSALETCRILQQLLFALREIHEAGYLHLDIQGGNVFLRGALEDKSDLLTLIDFGSARPMENGKTAPIRNREIFTSRGFSAPEMLLHNTGDLQLGVEADLYSAGCIALYLMTGQRPRQSQLLANRTRKYLKPNQMRWVGCPAHLQEQLQELLAKALEPAPENRFHCADAMLEEVNDLLEALQPPKTVLRSVKYDAFICYKHGPVDSAAAKTLQQSLEHFRTTDSASLKIRPFPRVFLDEGELAACADFGQQINDALKNSKWLIVICGRDTIQSPWVQLEIDTFLKIHGESARARILTVLTSGEPAESIPPCLWENEDSIKEPFAADARGKDLREILNALKGDAFLRLAAAMLDKPFDSLKQRQKIYLLQRIAVVAAICLLAAVAFAFYAVNRSNLIAAQADQIEKAYEDSLISESLLLAEQAEKQLKDNNPLDAMALALRALPSQEQDRPVVTEAEYVLGKALGIYRTPSGAEDKVTVEGLLRTDDDRFFLDDTGSYLFTWGKNNTGIRILDTRTMSPIRELLTNETIYHTSEELLLPEQNALLLRILGHVASVDYLTGEQNWSIETGFVLSMCLSEDKTRLVILSEREEEGSEEPVQYLDVLSADTGERLHQVSFRVDPDQDAQMTLVVSPDLKWAAAVAMDKEDVVSVQNVSHSLYLIRVEDGSCHKLLDCDTEIITAKFLEDRLAVVHGTGFTLTIKHSDVTYQYTDPIEVKIETYEPDSHKLVWSSEHRYYLRDDSLDALQVVPYDTGTVSGRGLLATLCDQCVLLDWETGVVVRKYGLQSAALDIRYQENGFDTLNADGSTTSAGYGIDTMVNLQYFEDSVSKICRHEDVYYVQSTPVFSRDYSIRKYRQNKSDESYRPLFDVFLRKWWFYDYRCLDGGVRLVLAGDNQICYLDSSDGRVLTHEIAPEYGFSGSQVLGISPDARRIYWQGGDWDSDTFWIGERPVYATELISGQTRQIPLPEKPEEYIRSMDTFYHGESLFFTASISFADRSELGLFRWDLADSTLTELYRHPLAQAEHPEDEGGKYQWEEYQYRSLQLDAQTGGICFATYTNRLEDPRHLFRLDPATGDAACISPAFSPEQNTEEVTQWKPHCYQWSPDGTYAAFGFGNDVWVTDREGELLFRVPVTGYDPAVRFLPDGNSLLVLTEDNVLRQYRIADGACLTDINLEDHLDLNSLDTDLLQLKTVDETTQLLMTGEDGFLLDISEDVLKIRAVLDQCIGYDAGTGRFLAAEDESYSSGQATVGIFPHYPLEELVRRANAILAGEIK